MKRVVDVKRLGLVDYQAALDLQRDLVDRRKRGDIPDQLLLLEHPDVITLGVKTRSDRSHVLETPEALAARGVALFETGRGGDVTYHGPGQLVAYPIFDLRPDRCDVRKYVQDLASVMIALCKDYGVAAGTIPGDSRYVGVWVDRESPKAWTEIDAEDARFPSRSLAKIGAIGVRLSRWVTSHGFALNVNTDLSRFGLIVPCGIVGRGVTSLQRILGHDVSMDEVAGAVVRAFEAVFSAQSA